jgi:hypothetical protein
VTYTNYDPVFFDALVESSLDSTAIISRIAVEAIAPASIVDFGCAEGHWLRAFQDLGVANIRGFDGAHVDKSRLVIAREDFEEIDLEMVQPTSRHYTLALCLEVAEHLSPDGGDRLIGAICKSADVAMFSAAVPRQGGTHHINEQWIEYWASRFNVAGWTVLDYFRPRIAFDRRIAWWYRQNLFLAVSPVRMDLVSKLSSTTQPEIHQEWIHVETLQQYLRLSTMIKQVPRALAGFVRFRLRRLAARSGRA